MTGDVGSLSALLEQPDTLLMLEPEELAGVVLQDISASERRRSGNLNRYNYSLNFRGASAGVQEAIMEAWVWLEKEGCIAPKPKTQGEWVFVTRRGRRLAEAQDTSAYKRAALLPKEFLHPIIAQKAWPAFLRGEYDTAVFQAFKQVEISVRKTGGFDIGDIGVQLMRKAMHPENGPLRDRDATSAEREALSSLFAGAIGSYKNPHSHRNVPLSEPIEPAEMIILASHLMKIVDDRAA